MQNDEVSKYRSSAAMWAFAVAMYGEQLRAEADQHVVAYLDAVTRSHYAKASDADRELLREHAAKATNVVTVAAAWRLGLHRYTFLHSAAQLLKCVVGLEKVGVAAPKLKDQELLRLLRNVDDHWEDTDAGRSMAELLKIRPDERPTRVVFSKYRVELGGLNIRDVVKWAGEVNTFVRAEAEADGIPLLHPDDPVSYDG
jgi:hypothetical protein